MEFNEAKKELQSYQSMERTITQLESWIEDKKQSTNKLTSTLSSEPRGSPKHQDGMVEKLTKVLDEEAELKPRIIEMKNKQKEILQKILTIEQPIQNILFSIYIVGNTIEETMDIVGYGRSETYRKRDKGIELYSRI